MFYAIAAVIALIVDQIVKYWATAHVVLNTGRRNLIPGFIHLANVHNTGAAFSFMEGARWFFVALCVVFVAALIYLLARGLIKGRLSRWMAVMVMSGALGNCIDRIINGYVVDMFEFDFLFFGHNFPVFNVADILITVGGIIFCVSMLLEKPEEAAKGPARRGAAQGGASAGRGNTGTAAKPERGRITPFPGGGTRQTRSGAKDSDNPFAEWERQAAAKDKKPGTMIRGESAAGGSLDEPMSHVRPAPGAKDTTARKPNSSSAGSDDSFDLEDILSEFRDL